MLICRYKKGECPALANQAICAAFMADSLDFPQMACRLLRRSDLEEEAEKIEDAVALRREHALTSSDTSCIGNPGKQKAFMRGFLLVLTEGHPCNLVQKPACEKAVQLANCTKSFGTYAAETLAKVSSCHSTDIAGAEH